MSAIRVEVTAEDLARARALPRMAAWSSPIEDTLGRITGQTVDVDGDSGTGNIATIGQGAWTIVVDLPEAANAWLNARWEKGDEGEPIAFDIAIDHWLVDLVRDDRPLLTLREASLLLGVKPSTLRQQAQDEWNGKPGPTPRARRIGVVKLGRDWFVDRVAVEREVARAAGQRLDQALEGGEV